MTERPERPRVRVLTVATLIALAAAGAGAGGLLARGSGPRGGGAAAAAAAAGVDPGSATGGRSAPGFRLRDQFGQPVSLAGLRGQVVLLSFVDAQCTTICPLTSTAMLDAKQMLGAAGRGLALVAVDANPRAIRVSDIAGYSAAHGLLHRWEFLTGSEQQLAAVWHAFGVYVAATTNGIDHEPVVYLLDRTGRERRLYVTQLAYAAVPAQALMMARAAAALLPGHPAVHPPSQGHDAPITPTQQVLLPATGGGPGQVLGPRRPHLVLFFDTWLGTARELAARLTALNGYADLARARGWPGLVAVDEAPVETGQTALRDLLRTMARPLHYPVVVDTTGRVADGYGVADEPWFELVSAGGRIRFRNDGWFPIPALTRAVAKAEATGD